MSADVAEEIQMDAPEIVYEYAAKVPSEKATSVSVDYFNSLRTATVSVIDGSTYQVGSEVSSSFGSPSLGYRFAKRLFDILISVCAIVICAIPVLVLSVAIAAESHGAPFYVSHRIGKNGKPIRVLKLRSMVSDSDNLEKYFTPEQLELWHREHKVDDDPRVTRIGRFLRATSLDELPQFLNVFAGQMSVVGPRPITMEELSWFNNLQRRELLSVRPGITGYWQVNGRNDNTFISGKRQRMELFYVHHQGVKMDVDVFLKTFEAVFKRTGK